MRSISTIIIFCAIGYVSIVAQSITDIKNEDRTAPLKLNDIIERAIHANPEIKMMLRTLDMMRARIPQAGALPDPMLSVGYMGNPVPFPPFDLQNDDPSSGRFISFTQEFPYPGKLSLKSRISKSNLEVEWWNYEQTLLNIIAEVKDAYFDLYYIHKSIDTTVKNKELLEKFAKITEIRYSVGQGIQQDVLKAHVEISKLIEQLAMLEQRKIVTEARLNTLQNLAHETFLGKPEEINLRELKYSLAELNNIAIANYPSLKAQQTRVDREQYNIQLACKEFYPDFSVGMTYIHRPRMPEMYGLNVSIKIPLYFKQKQFPSIREATAGADVEHQRYLSTMTLLMFKIKDRYLAATTAYKLAKLYATMIIPQSTLSVESAIAGYESGKVDFLTLLDNIITLRSYELSYYEQLSNVEKSITSLEPLVGISLTH